MLFILNQIKRNSSSIPKLEYKKITCIHFDKVMHHLRNSFFIEEPVNIAVGLSQTSQGYTEFEKDCYTVLEDNVSLMAVNDKNEIAGVLLNGVSTCDHNMLAERLNESCDESHKKSLRFFNMINEKANIFQTFNIDKFFDLYILSVDKRFRGMGISNELIKQSEQLARNSNFKLMKAEATGIYSQKIFKSNGFFVLLEYYYDKCLDEAGNQILKVEPPHTKLELVIKCLD